MPTKIPLETITLAGIKDGGYTIKWEGAVPSASSVCLCLVRRDNRFDVTGGYTKERLPQLLAEMAGRGFQVRGAGSTRASTGRSATLCRGVCLSYTPQVADSVRR